MTSLDSNLAFIQVHAMYLVTSNELQQIREKAKLGSLYPLNQILKN